MRENFDFSIEKDSILRQKRGIGFKEIVDAMSSEENILADIDHFNKDKYPAQRIYIVQVEGMVYAVPYVKDVNKSVIFLKTIYPSRKLKKKYYK